MRTVDVLWDFKLHIPIIPEEIKVKIRSGEQIRLRITQCSGYVKNAEKWGVAGINIESSERNKGLEGMPLKEKYTEQNPQPDRDNHPQKMIPNNHPTVKPISLMKYIIKLLSPPGNPICLDPFAGSGSTLFAAKELGINCIGIEKELEYFEIAKKRIEAS